MCYPCLCQTTAPPSRLGGTTKAPVSGYPQHSKGKEVEIKIYLLLQQHESL